MLHLRDSFLHCDFGRLAYLWAESNTFNNTRMSVDKLWFAFLLHNLSTQYTFYITVFKLLGVNNIASFDQISNSTTVAYR